MKEIKYLTCRMRSCYNRMIELNLQMFILKRFVMKNYFVHVSMQILMLNIFKNGENNISERSVGLYFNCGIKLNQKMLILKRFVAKKYFFFMSGSSKLILNIFKNGKKINIRSIVWSFVLIVWLNWRFVAKTDLFMWWWQLNCL